MLTIEYGNVDSWCSFVFELDLLRIPEVECFVEEQFQTLEVSGKFCREDMVNDRQYTIPMISSRSDTISCNFLFPASRKCTDAADPAGDPTPFPFRRPGRLFTGLPIFIPTGVATSFLTLDATGVPLLVASPLFVVDPGTVLRDCRLPGVGVDRSVGGLSDTGVLCSAPAKLTPSMVVEVEWRW